MAHFLFELKQQKTLRLRLKNIKKNAVTEHRIFYFFYLIDINQIKLSL